MTHKQASYFKGRKCRKCDKDLSVNFHGLRYYGESHKEIWDGTWVCNRCNIDIREKVFRYHDTIKSMRDRRTGYQDPNSSNAKGDLFQDLTCRWRSSVSTIPVEDLNKKLDNHTTPIDHTPDSELGIIQTKGRFCDSLNRCWSQRFVHERNAIRRGFKFDVVIFYCASQDGKTIERLYIFPVSEVINRSNISIYKNNSRGPGWYEQYRVKDYETIESINEIWKEIIMNKGE